MAFVCRLQMVEMGLTFVVLHFYLISQNGPSSGMSFFQLFRLIAFSFASLFNGVRQNLRR